jgi:hypothetical protein
MRWRKGWEREKPKEWVLNEQETRTGNELGMTTKVFE